MPSDSTPLWSYGAGDLAEAIRAGRATSEEVVQAHLDRIETTNGSLNAVTVVLRDEALVGPEQFEVDGLALGEQPVEERLGR